MHTCKTHKDLILLAGPIPPHLAIIFLLSLFSLFSDCLSGLCKTSHKVISLSGCLRPNERTRSSKLAISKAERIPGWKFGKWTRENLLCVWATFSTRTVVNFWSAQPLGQFNFDFPFIQWLRKSRVHLNPTPKKKTNFKENRRKIEENSYRMGSGHWWKRKWQMQERKSQVIRNA